MKLDNTMAIIKDAKFGVGDRGKTTLTFSTFITEGSAALQVFYDMDEISSILEKYGVEDVPHLNGKACWVDTSKQGLITWVGPCVIRS